MASVTTGNGIGDNVRDLAGDLENWMSQLPQQLRQQPIVNISIPGSHDSFTSDITKDSDIAPDAEQIVQDLAVLGPLIKEVIARWSKAQGYMANDQLIRGVRYFDIRTATKTGTDDLYVVHSLYSVRLQKCLDEINSFLDSHPNEVVVLDFQHFYAFTDDTHNNLQQDINNTFGSKILPPTGSFDGITLESMAQSGQQVIVTYRIDGTIFWPSSFFPNPWPNTTSKTDLIDSLNYNLSNRQANIPFISQCVLTPDAEFIIGNFLSSLQEKCAKELEDDRSKWIEAQSAGTEGLNIIIADFIELSDCKYVRDVINVNQTLLNAKKL